MSNSSWIQVLFMLALEIFYLVSEPTFKARFHAAQYPFRIDLIMEQFKNHKKIMKSQKTYLYIQVGVYFSMITFVE